jgi:hypothetical protein
MKYILLGYTNVDEWRAADAEMAKTGQMTPEVQAACDFYEQLTKELIESGEFVTTEGLGDPSHSRTLRRRTDGSVVTTDGPFAEAKEALVSYAIIDVASHDRALEIAARVVAATGDAAEVRPIMGPSGMEM